MTQIDKNKPVMVTGATGYVAGWLMKKLLDDGLTVHAPVRNPDKKEKVQHLNELAANSPGQIKYFNADLLEEGSYAEAMEGCELVYHTASPFTVNVENPQKQLIDPAVNGTRNVLEQAKKTESVKRVVLTSSCAAIYTDNKDIQEAPGQQLTEDIWNTTASLDHQPYSLSKTLAEEEAWKINESQERWDMVVVNPALVLGPALNPTSSNSESLNILKQLGDGTMKMGVPKIGFGVVDVRDLADAHFHAGFKPEANGRNIIVGHNSDLLEMSQIIHEKYGDQYPVPNSAIPKWLLTLVGPMVNKSITRKYVKNNVNLPFNADNSKSKQMLDVNYRPLKETMNDAFKILIDADMVKKK